MKKFLTEFKEFISKGNVIDMAVAVVIGGGFSKIVTSLVNDVIMPLISMLTGGISVSEWKYVITPAVLDEAGAELSPEVAFMYGNFIQTVIDFLIIAFCIFVVLKIFLGIQSKFKKNEEELVEEAAPEETELSILKEIRDSLKK